MQSGSGNNSVGHIGNNRTRNFPNMLGNFAAYFNQPESGCRIVQSVTQQIQNILRNFAFFNQVNQFDDGN